MLAMALFPEVQKKAQEELDLVVGLDRLPEYHDLTHMPYVRAVVMETLRWMPALCSGLPHGVIEDDIYKGYHIPKGTMIIPVSGKQYWTSMQLIRDSHIVERLGDVAQPC